MPLSWMKNLFPSGDTPKSFLHLQAGTCQPLEAVTSIKITSRILPNAFWWLVLIYPLFLGRWGGTWCPSPVLPPAHSAISHGRCCMELLDLQSCCHFFLWPGSYCCSLVFTETTWCQIHVCPHVMLDWKRYITNLSSVNILLHYEVVSSLSSDLLLVPGKDSDISPTFSSCCSYRSFQVSDSFQEAAFPHPGSSHTQRYHTCWHCFCSASEWPAPELAALMELFFSCCFPVPFFLLQ